MVNFVSGAILNFDPPSKTLDPPLGYMAHFMHYILPGFRLHEVNCKCTPGNGLQDGIP